MKARILLFALVCALTGQAQAQSTYPSRPVRIVVPSPPGGGTDIVARVLAQYFSNAMGQQFYVENKPGAGNMIGIESVARAAPDGYTLLFVPSTLALNSVMYKKVSYDPVRDFAPITEIATIPNLVVVNADVTKVHTLAEFIALAKRQPGALSYASNGQGTSNHLASELLKTAAGINLIHVPYKGSGPALNDLLGGQVAMMMDVVMTSYPHIKAGKLTALAVTGTTRSPLLPDVPTVAEQGFPGFEAMVWFGVFAPARTPPAVVDYLNRELVAAIRGPKLMPLLESQGAQVVAGTPAELAARMQDEIVKWRKVVQSSGAKVE